MRFVAPTTVYYGESPFEEFVATSGASLGRAFIISDRTVSSLGFVDKVVGYLREGGLKEHRVFDDVPQDSSLRTVEECLEEVKGFSPDIIVAIGGGSVIDTAKAVCLLYTLGGKLSDYEGYGTIEKPIFPLLAIPTTAGTGSEVSFYAVIKDTENRRKIGLVSPYLAPKFAILSPEFTETMPPRVASATGIDALAHALEAYVAVNTNPFAQMFAEKAVSKIFKFLPVSVRDRKNRKANLEMLLSANMAGFAFSLSMVGIVHAIAHAMGGLFGVPHGEAIATIIVPSLEFNAEAVGNLYGELARATGAGKTAEDLIEAVAYLIDSLPVPKKLREVGIAKADLEMIAESALLDGSLVGNPREAGKEDILAILKKAL